MAFRNLILVLVVIVCVASQGDARPSQGSCKSSGTLRAPAHLPPHCEDCCKPGARYPQFKCSPPLSNKTNAILTVNGFEKGQEGGGASSCDGKFHSNKEMVVALSTGWFNNRKMCGKTVLVSANGRTVAAKVVDECDSVRGCDSNHGFQPPCPNNVVDGSPAVWAALGISKNNEKFGWMDITWTSK